MKQFELSVGVRKGLYKNDAAVAKRYSTVQGFGLIELMISMVIASFLVLGLAVMAGNMQGTYATQTQYSAVHDKERFASALFSNVLQSAGDFTTTITQPTGILTAVTDVLPATIGNGSGAAYLPGQFMWGTAGASATLPDSLNVRYYSASSADKNGVTCLGVPYDTGYYESVLSISGGNLVCQVGVGGAAPASAPVGATAGSSVVLIDGVSNMKILYGVSLDGNNFAYYSASQMTATQWATGGGPAYYSPLKSVMITLTFALSAADLKFNPNATPTQFTQIYQVMYGAL
jgi:prepilin-type N-terminal cleavage/methylation domain-containing protein